MSNDAVVLAVDGNSLLHRAFHSGARTGFRAADGRPLWAIQGLLNQIVIAADRSCADAIVVGFDDPDVSVRRATWPDYKAQRPEKLANLACQLREAPGVVAELGVPVVVPRGLEADDLLASVAAAAPAWGAQAVLLTSDRDAFALIDHNTRVLRLINGGAGVSPMLTPERLEILTGIRPDQYRDFAALRGDPSDNLPGIPGIGPVIAARLLRCFGTAQAMFSDIADGGRRCRDVVGQRLMNRLAEPNALTVWRRNVDIMTMRSTASVGLDLSDPAHRLPLHPGRVEQVYSRFDLGVRSAVQVLCGADDVPLRLRTPPLQHNGPAAELRPARLHVGHRSQPRNPRQLTLFS